MGAKKRALKIPLKLKGKVKKLWEGHKIWKNLPPVLTKQLFLLSSVKTSGRFFQIFVAFSEKLNFKANTWTSKVVKNSRVKTTKTRKQIHWIILYLTQGLKASHATCWIYWHKFSKIILPSTSGDCQRPFLFLYNYVIWKVAQFKISILAH